MSNKIDRKAVYAKYNGHCAYCGRKREKKEALKGYHYLFGIKGEF